MYSVNKIIEKLNNNYVANSIGLSINGEKIEKALTLSDFMKCSLSEINEMASNTLTCDEKEFLYQQAQKEKHNNTKEKVNILRRANPQIGDKVSLGINSSLNQTSYNNLFENNAGVNVDPKSVASQFSAASYLRELYSHAVDLYNVNSIYHIDNRRPDIKNIELSQENLEKEISALSLSNNVIKEKITKDNKFTNDIMEEFSKENSYGYAPFNLPFLSINNILNIIGGSRKELDYYINLYSQTYDDRKVLCLNSEINPVLQSIIYEELNNNTNEIIKKHFTNIPDDPDLIIDYLSRHYNVDIEKLTLIIKEVNEGYYNNLIKKSANAERNLTILKVNKIILLYKSTGISISDIKLLLNSENDLDKGSLDIYCTARYFMELYQIDFSKALIMSGGKINEKIKINHQDTCFDRIFNTPIKDNNKFKTTSSPSELTEHEINSLKRAFNVTETELKLLLKYVKGNISNNDKYKLDINFLSSLYRVKLFSDAHNLSVTDLTPLSKIMNIDFNNSNYYIINNK